MRWSKGLKGRFGGMRRHLARGNEGWRCVSVVIPAFNERAWLGACIRSVRMQGVAAEIVVVENGSTDGTAAIAHLRADRVVRTERPAGYSRARNLGAAVARGDLLVFLDADSRAEAGALETLLSEARPETFGTVLGRPDPPRLRYRLFFLLKNLGHRLGLYRGVLGGLLYCDAGLFRRIGGFDEGLTIDELHDFSRRARRAGGRYRLVAKAWASTSMRRFERVGLWSSFLFWARVRFRAPARGRFRVQLEAYPAFRRDAAHRAAPAPRSRPSRGPRSLAVRPEPTNEP
jgi:glycosyltransferase involved in cell wall biosynthesis